MKPKLIPHWKRTLLRAYSMWSVYIAAVLGAADYLVPYLPDYLPRWVPIVILITAPIFRVIEQRDLNARQQTEKLNPSKGRNRGYLGRFYRWICHHLSRLAPGSR